jgi:regulator of replication initiation timing
MTEEELEKDYDYWIGLTFSDGSNVSPKDRAYFLTKLKREYLSTLRENQKIDVLSNTVEKLTKELSEERSLNSDLTEENERLTVAYETLKLHDEEEIRMKDFRIKELETQIEKMKKQYDYAFSQLCESREIVCSMLSQYRDKKEIDYSTRERGEKLLKQGVYINE